MTVNSFFALAGATIVLVHAGLWLKSINSPTIRGFRVHHYMYGIGFAASYFFHSSPAILAIGVGLVIDELPLFVIYRGVKWPNHHWDEYLSWQCFGGAAGILIASYLAVSLL